MTPEEAPPGTAEHASPPASRAALVSLTLLLVALVAVVGDAKLLSPTVERAVSAAGLPVSVVGVIIAMLILLPETLAAMRAAQRDRMQISLNLAFGSAIASIGLTIPTIAWIDLVAGSAAPWPRCHPHRAAGVDLYRHGADRGSGTRDAVAGRRAPDAVAAYLFLAISP